MPNGCMDKGDIVGTGDAWPMIGGEFEIEMNGEVTTVGAGDIAIVEKEDVDENPEAVAAAMLVVGPVFPSSFSGCTLEEVE
jgi:hypothetical protein